MSKMFHQRLFISLFIILTLISCGQRSGVSNDKSSAAICGVKDPNPADTIKIVPKTESEKNGHELFMLHCRQCHAPLTIQPCSGKSLQGVLDRIPAPSEKYFTTFIRDSYSLKQSGDAYANKVDVEAHVEYEHKFSNLLTDKEIEDIIVYIRLASKSVE